ncbi:MAG TPA: AAA family ATPase [Streptosporangiaceae bacterium]|nr:AAA family ATPase [Streptosporangiaceae bacterium]
MNGATIFAGFSIVAFAVVLAMAFTGAWSAGKAPAEEGAEAAAPRLGRGAAPARPRALRAIRSDRRDSSLAPDALVSFGAERTAAGIDDILAALDDDLVGLLPVKQKVQQIAALLLVDRARQKFGLDAPRPNLHMCFTGPPGTGKTTVAMRMAELLHRLGYLENGQLVHAMRDDLVGEFIGHTAPKTKRVLARAMGGVLFIDEAYYLYRDADSKDYGQEAIDILLQVMENERDKLVVILAGYKDRMDHFFSSNPGMSSRIAHHLDFVPYEVGEMVDIGRLMLRQTRYYLSDAAEAAFRDYLTERMRQPWFANARSVRNELERARLRHAHRLASEPDRHWSRDDLMRLEPADILTPAHPGGPDEQPASSAAES